MIYPPNIILTFT